MAEQTVPALPPIPSSPDASKSGNNQIQIPNTPDILVGPSSKDILLGAGALLVLTIVIFFIRISFVNYLIGPGMKRSPNGAGMAGWGLFGGLFFGAALCSTALVSKSYMTLPLIIALLILSLICFVITGMVASKK